jgi:hypothetical protein
MAALSRSLCKIIFRKKLFGSKMKGRGGAAAGIFCATFPKGIGSQQAFSGLMILVHPLMPPLLNTFDAPQKSAETVKKG